MFVFLHAVTRAHLAVNRYGNKPRICDHAIPAGAEGLESYSPICVSEVCVCVCIYVCMC